MPSMKVADTYTARPLALPDTQAYNPRQDSFDFRRTLLGLRRRYPWIVDGVVTTRDLANESAVVLVAGPDEVIELALNISDTVGPMPEGEVLLCSEGCAETVPPHGWAIGVRARTEEDVPFLPRALP